MVGRRFGRLTVVSYCRIIGTKASWYCNCDCGKEVVVNSNLLQTGNTKSCGCLQKDIQHWTHFKHGLSGQQKGERHPHYYVWVKIMAGCYKRGCLEWKRMGAHGATVCEEWHDATKFCDWAATQEPIPNRYMIGRIDKTKPFSPDNCKFFPPRGKQKSYIEEKKRLGCEPAL